MMILHEKFIVTVDIEKCDYAKQFNKRGLVLAPDAIIVQYDDYNGSVIVDERAADDDYLKWAIIQEVASHSSNEEFCGLKLPQPNDPTRRRMVEKIMMTVVVPQKDKETYARRRLEAYQALLDFHYKDDDLRLSLVDAYSFLQLWIINHTGKRYTSIVKGGRKYE